VVTPPRAEITMKASSRLTVPQASIRKPVDDEVDVYGLTHPGLVRSDNQDHFLICSLHKQMRVHQSNLADIDEIPSNTERLAFLAMVADGVGGSSSGNEASRAAVEAITLYVSHSMHCYYTADATEDDLFIEALNEAAMHCHEYIVKKSDAEGRFGMATTLTLWLGVWPRAYVLQVGDSRYYLLQDEDLEQISSDQTVGQELIDRGIITRASQAGERWAHVLSSTLGGPQASPVVTGVEQNWGFVHMLCSDGLTRHVPDERIRERLLEMKSAREACEGLLEDALDGGGKDNITIIVGRAVRKS
jgi:protein phosphatase